MDIRLITALVLLPSLAVSTFVSKACFGSYGHDCTAHTLGCEEGNITIQGAYYINNNRCPKIGLANCLNISVSNINETGEQKAFSSNLTWNMCKNCSLKQTCKINAGREDENFNFSIVKYECIKGSVKGSCSTNMSTGGSVNGSTEEGAIAGGVTTVIIICIIVAGVIFWLKFIRNKKKDKKPENVNVNCALAGSASIADVQLESSRETTSNYDYTTINDGFNPVGRSQNHYVPAGKPSTNDGTTVLMEDDYNHINQNHPQGASSPGYDTTASAAAAVKKLKDASSNSIDDDDYNHLSDGKPNVVSSDYDTTVSASKAVAQLGEMKESEDDYDHFKRYEGKIIDSPYDTANHHNSASSDTTSSPYDLAK